MLDQKYQGISILYSKTEKYKIEKVNNGKKYFPAVILKKVRSYWEPVEHGVNMREEDLIKYLEEQV